MHSQVMFQKQDLPGSSAACSTTKLVMWQLLIEIACVMHSDFDIMVVTTDSHNLV